MDGLNDVVYVCRSMVEFRRISLQWVTDARFLGELSYGGLLAGWVRGDSSIRGTWKQ